VEDRWLADALAGALDEFPGSAERAHVCALLDVAPKFRLGTDCVQAVEDTLAHAPNTLERCLDRLVLPGGPAAWIEYPRHHGRCGCLLASEPSGDGHVACFVAWQASATDDGSAPIYHSYAILHWDLPAMAKAADAARFLPVAGARERIEELGVASVPPGLQAEMEIWQELDVEDRVALEAALSVTRRQALSEHAFLLGAVLLLDTDAVTLVETTDDGNRPSWIANLEPRRARWPRRGGFGKALLGDLLHWRIPAKGR
jgi:hypothetical protein